MLVRSPRGSAGTTTEGVTMRDNYRTIPAKLRDLQTVQGNSMTAELESDGRYWVRSYATCIAAYDPADRTLYMNTGRYSPTTSRHQGTLYALAREARFVVEVDRCGMGSSAWERLRDVADGLAPVLA